MLRKILVAFAVMIMSSAHAQTAHSRIAKITAHHTGWGEPQVRVTLEGETYNEFPSCNTNTQDGYVLKAESGADNGYDTPYVRVACSLYGWRESSVGAARLRARVGRELSV